MAGFYNLQALLSSLCFVHASTLILGYTFFSTPLRIWFCCIAVLANGASSAKVLTARNIAINKNSQGFYEYLPKDYQSGTQYYPIIIHLHGQGELGNGGSQLPNLLKAGIPQYINKGAFPDSFVVHGQTFEFLVIAPQFIAWPTVTDVDAVINYALANYRVDQTRIFLTGYSMGGGATILMIMLLWNPILVALKLSSFKMVYLKT